MWYMRRLKTYNVRSGKDIQYVRVSRASGSLSGTSWVNTLSVMYMNLVIAIWHKDRNFEVRCRGFAEARGDRDRSYGAEIIDRFDSLNRQWKEQECPGNEQTLVEQFHALLQQISQTALEWRRLHSLTQAHKVTRKGDNPTRSLPRAAVSRQDK